MERLRNELTSYIDHQLNLFSECSEYDEYFLHAEYDRPADMIDDFEEAAFRSALSPAERHADINELDSWEILRGFRVVIRNRLGRGDLAEIRSEIQLFNGIMEGALGNVEYENPCSHLQIETAEEFGPRFVDWLLKSVEDLNRAWIDDPFWKFIGEKFAPLKPLLDVLHTLVHSELWPYSDLAVGELLLIVYYFKQVMEEEWQF